MPNYTSYGVHECWVEHSDLSFGNRFSTFNYGIGTLTRNFYIAYINMYVFPLANISFIFCFKFKGTYIWLVRCACVKKSSIKIQK